MEKTEQKELNNKIRVIPSDYSKQFIKNFNNNKPTEEFIESCKKAKELFGEEKDKSTDQNVADVPSDDLISREELLKKLDRQIEWEEANAIPYEDADGGCILGLKKARKYVKLASSTEKPNANDCDLISREDAIEAGNKIVEELSISSIDWDALKCWAKELFDALPSADYSKPLQTTLNGDLISRQDALEQMAQAECGLHYEDCEADKCFCSYIQRILDLPSADRPQVNSNSAEEQIAEICDRPKGEWKWTHGGQCSECGFHNTNFDFNFCPNCGADMRGDVM